MSERAIVRRPTEAYRRCIRRDESRAIDFEKALVQHEEYRKALAACGLFVEELPAAPGFPDACFVEDTAVTDA